MAGTGRAVEALVPDGVLALRSQAAKPARSKAAIARRAGFDMRKV